MAQMRALEAAAIAVGMTESALQARAGQAVADEVRRLLGPADRVAVLVGHGNNGRDGGVAAERLATAGTPIDLSLGPRHALTEAELDQLRRLGATIASSDVEQAIGRAARGARVAIDALAGIGARGALREPLASMARQLNLVRKERGSQLQVVAVDVPSGIDADTGEVPGEAVWADRTVTLGAVKQGLLRFPAAEHVGLLVPKDIGIPASPETSPYTCLEISSLGQVLPPRPLGAHKYRFGRVLVVAGSDHFLGAPVLCASAAARAGAGLVTVGSTRAVRASVVAHLPEATYTQTAIEVEADPGRAADDLRPYLASHQALVIGPGLGRSAAAVSFVRRVLSIRAEVAAPTSGVVIDADALVALADWPRWWDQLGANAMLTPHAGELARLVGEGEPPADEAPWARAGRLATEWGCVLVAKGPFTSVARPDGRVEVWPRANPALATGGTGDVLAGVCAGLLAQGATAWDAARLGVAAHARAAQHIVESRGWRSLLASDLVLELPAALAHLGETSRSLDV